MLLVWINYAALFNSIFVVVLFVVVKCSKKSDINLKIKFKERIRIDINIDCSSNKYKVNI